MSNRDTKVILDDHEGTKHSEWSVRSSRHGLDFENQPLPFKVYRGLEPIPLVRDFLERDVPALEAIARGPEAVVTNEPAERIPDLAALSRLLQLSAGITKRRRHAGGTLYVP